MRKKKHLNSSHNSSYLIPGDSFQKYQPNWNWKLKRL